MNYVDREPLREELRKLGVSSDQLVIGFTAGQVVFSGELKSFHQVQLAHLAARNVFPDREVVLNLSVNNQSKQEAKRETEETELHRLRNDLNRFVVGTQVILASLQLGDFDAARTAARDLLNSGAADAAAKLPSMQGRRLLVVEDDVNESNLLCGLLRRAGAMVTQAHDAVTAYRLIDAGFVPEVVLLDMHLPNSNGKQIADRIRARENGMGIGLVAISGTNPLEIGLHIRDGELDAWLPKPLNVERLMLTLHNFLAAANSSSS